MKKTILTLVLMTAFVYSAMPQSQGPYNPGTAQSSQNGCLSCLGSIWGNPNYVMASDNQTASTTMAAVSNCFQSTCWYSRELLSTNFGFNVPTSNINIVGIKAEIQRNAFSANVIKDTIVRLLLSGATIGNNLALANKWGITNNYYTYGGATNMWGTALTPANVNDATFGVSLKTANTSTSNQSAYVDHVRMTVYYTTTTGITYSVSSENGISAYFNDRRNLTLSYRLDKDASSAQLSVYNLLGQSLYSKKLEDLSAGSHMEEFGTSAFEAGVYVVRLSTPQGEYTRKVTLGQ